MYLKLVISEQLHSQPHEKLSMNVATFSVFMKFIKTFERTQLACTPWSTQLWTFFHLNYCSISSVPH